MPVPEDNPSFASKELAEDAEVMAGKLDGATPDPYALPEMSSEQTTTEKPQSLDSISASASASTAPPPENVVPLDSVPRTALDKLKHVVDAGKPSANVQGSTTNGVPEGMIRKLHPLQHHFPLC